MSGGAGSPLFYPFPNDLGEDNLAISSLRHSFKVLSLNCTNAQILELARSFRRCLDEEIIRWADESRQHASSISSSNRASLFSVLSGLSQATTLSNQSQPPPLPTKRPQGEIRPPAQLYLQPQPASIQELAEPVNQGSPISISKGPTTVYICVACNKPCRNKSSLSRHQKQHCERKVEWLCSLCVPPKSFYRREKLSEHHINKHSKACLADCKQQRGGLCVLHLSLAMVPMWPKKAWGCPCCLQCFDTLAAWTSHSAIHPVQNDSVVGWSLITMVQSLLLQPYLKEAVARLPWEICDLAGVKAEVCQDLREVLERHRLPNTVNDHYDYRYLQLPEKLAHYAFRLLANGEVFLDDVSTVASRADIGGNRHRGQMSAPVFNMSGSTALSYWSPEDPSAYDENAHQSVGTGHVHESQDARPLSNAKGLGVTAEPVSGGYSSHPCDQVLQTSSDISFSHRASSLAPVDVPGNALQESSCGEKVHDDLSMQNPLQNLAHLPSSAKATILYTKPLPGVPVLTDGTRRSRSGDRHRRRHSRSLSRSRERRRDNHHGFEKRDHRRDQIPLPTLPDMTLELSNTAAAVDHNTDSARTESKEADSISSELPRLSARMSDIRTDDWHIWGPDEPYNP